MLEYIILGIAFISASVTLYLHFTEKSPEFRCAAIPEAEEAPARPSKWRSAKTWSGVLAFVLFVANWQLNVQQTLKKEEERKTELKRAIRGVYTFRSISVIADYTISDPALLAQLLPVALLDQLTHADAHTAPFEYKQWHVESESNAARVEIILTPPEGIPPPLGENSQLHKIVGYPGRLSLKVSPTEFKKVDPQLQTSLSSEKIDQSIVEVRLGLRRISSGLKPSSASIKIRYSASFVPLHPRAPFSTVDADLFYCNMQFEHPKDNPLLKDIYQAKTQQRATFDCALGDFLADAQCTTNEKYVTADINLEIRTYNVLKSR